MEFYWREHICLILGSFQRIISYLGGGADEAGPEEAGRRGADGRGVEGASSCGALVIDRLVGGYHGACQLKAAIVAVVLNQGQRVVLF